MRTIKRTLLTVLLIVAGLSLAAQERTDTTYMFRFEAGNDMFFSPWGGNENELSRLTEYIDQNRSAIDAGQMYLYVTSYGTDGNADQTATEVAKIRRNRVKSELILRLGIKEQNFLTDKDSDDSFYVDGQELRNVVIVVMPAAVEKVAEIAGEEAAAKVDAYNKEVSGEAERERQAAEKAEQERIAAEKAAAEKAEAERLAAEKAAAEKAEAERLAAEKAAAEKAEAERLAAEQAAATAIPYHFALRANLLRWATLTPDLGIEWRISRSVGILINSSYTSWSWDNKNRRYALWELNPEVRWYLGQAKRGYLGAMYKVGSFNYKFSENGKQGDLMGGGITGGYQLRLGKALSLDFSLGLGYVNADYEKYTVIDGVRVRQGDETKDWWGPTQAGVTLVWTIF